MQDDLNRPLGLERERESRFGRPVAWLPLAFGGLGLIAASLIAFVIITGNRDAGEPFAIARIEQEKPITLAPAAPANAPFGIAWAANVCPRSTAKNPTMPAMTATIDAAIQVFSIRPVNIRPPRAVSGAPAAAAA